MFTKWGNFVQRFRKTVLIVMLLMVGALGFVGQHLPDYLSQSGWFDPKSDSIAAAELEESTFGRDNSADVVVMYDAPPGTTVDNKAFAKKVQSHLDALAANNPEYIDGIASYWNTKQAILATKDKQHAMASIRLKGWGNDILKNYRKVEDQIPVPGVDQHIAGQTPVSGALDTGMAKDIKRAELAGLPIVGVLLIIVFGGVLAALLPLLVGGLSIVGSTGILTLIGMTTEVNAFAQSCVTLIGLGLAIDYALFIVSRFREELAEGYTTHEAVTRAVATAGRTVVFSGIMVGVSLSAMLIFPQAFLKSVAYGTISAVVQAAVLSLTVLPIMLSYLGKRVDWLSLKRKKKDPTPEQLYNGLWGRISGAAMKHPVATMIPIIVIMLLMAIPMGNLSFGGINETYLPPNNETRLAQEAFDREFPQMRTNPIKLVVKNSNGVQTGAIRAEANQVEGLTGDFQIVKQTDVDEQGRAITVMQTGIVNMNDNARVVKQVRQRIAILKAGGGTSEFAGISMQGAEVYVGGNPALEKDSITALLRYLPAMTAYMLVAMMLLMFLTFGSLVIPLKAIIMTLLSIASTLGILTLIFIDGLGADLLNFTPGPMMSAVLVLIIAILFGLSTDYEVFLVSRMVEAHAAGHTTREAIRFGTASTGRIITAAAAIMIVVTGAFGFSEIVMMKYIAFGMVIALFLDATIVRMLLVPSVMKVLDDDNWWAPARLKRLQHRLGLSESELSSDGESGLMDFGPQAARERAKELGIPESAVLASVGAGGTVDEGPVRTAKRLRVDASQARPVHPEHYADRNSEHHSADYSDDDQHAEVEDTRSVSSADEDETYRVGDLIVPRSVSESVARAQQRKKAASPTDTPERRTKLGSRRKRRRAERQAERARLAAEKEVAQREAELHRQETEQRRREQAQREAQNAARRQAASVTARYEDDYDRLFDHTDTQRSSYEADGYEHISRDHRPTLQEVPRRWENRDYPESWADSSYESRELSTEDLMRRLHEEED